MRGMGNLASWLTVAMLFNSMNARARSSESSEEYLQKVMTELQKLNAPASTSAQEHAPLSVDYKSAIYGSSEEQGYVKHAISENAHQDTRKHGVQDAQRYTILPIDKVGLNPTEAQPLRQYYQTRTPLVTKIQKPESVGFTRAELAAMYKNALEKGSAISLSSLTNALASGDKPHVTGTHLELPVAKPMYQYYFFPLKSFMSELNKDHGYKTIPALESTEASEVSPQTQLANPLFVAISTFVSIALMFMVGVLFLPKLAQYGITQARDMQDEFLRLTSFVTGAVDRRSSLDGFTDLPFDVSRYNSTRRIKRRRRKGGTVAVVKQKLNPVSW